MHMRACVYIEVYRFAMQSITRDVSVIVATVGMRFLSGEVEDVCGEFLWIGGCCLVEVWLGPVIISFLLLNG